MNITSEIVLKMSDTLDIVNYVVLIICNVFTLLPYMFFDNQFFTMKFVLNYKHQERYLKS